LANGGWKQLGGSSGLYYEPPADADASPLPLGIERRTVTITLHYNMAYIDARAVGVLRRYARQAHAQRLHRRAHRRRVIG
jgi:hypothetical protein